MAQVVKLPGAQPVNAGEQKVLDAFALRLRPTTRIFPNVRIRLGQQGLVEMDQLVITEDRVWVIEVKDLYGDVAFLKGQHIVDGERRADPVARAELNAKKIKGRLKKHGLDAGVYVEYLVVLAKAPQKLEIDPEYRGFIRSIEDAAARIDDPTAHGLPPRELTAEHREAIEAALALEPRIKDLRPKLGNIVAQRLVADEPARQLWAALELPMELPWLLEVLRRRPQESPADWSRRQAEAIEHVKMLQMLAGAPALRVPQTIARGDDGDPIIVHPVPGHPTLADQLDEVAVWPEALRRRVLRRITSGLVTCESKAIAHRLIGPNSIVVDAASGEAWLTQFTHAWRDGDPERVAGEEWRTLTDGIWAAPEHFVGGPVGRGADHYALGGLAQTLWEDGLPEDLAGPVAALTASDPADRRQGLIALAEALRPKPAAAMVEPAVGVVWAGHRLEERLGLAVEPGVSVWRAVSQLTQQQVVIRIYDEDAGHGGAELLSSALKGVSHPNLASMTTAELHQGRAYVITDFVPGPSVRVALEQTGPLGSDAAVTAAGQVLEVLSRVHPERSDGRPAIVHRRVNPDNVIANPARGAVLVNFGPPPSDASQVAVNTSRYRPAHEAISADDPDPDLFAVGVLLHEIATGQHPFSDDDPYSGELRIDPSLDADLRRILHRALAGERAERFSSATEFLAELVALGLPAVAVPQVADDVLAIRRRIDAALRERRWDDAEAACPSAWGPVLRRIRADRAQWEVAEARAALLTVEGFRLRFVEERRDITVAVPGDGELVGDDRVYLADREDGTALEIAVFVTAQGTGLVRVTKVLHGDSALQRLQQGLRIGIRGCDDGRLTMDLRQARFVADSKPGKHPISQFLVTASELDMGSGMDVAETLSRFGSDAYGTRAEVFGETGKKRNEMCVAFPRRAVDLPAVAYVLTRIAPVVRRIRHHS